MQTRHYVFAIQVAAPAARIFDLVADMSHYDVWLLDSSAFHSAFNATTGFDPGPVLKPGRITEYDPPHHIGFKHTVQVRFPFTTSIEARVRYAFNPNSAGTHIERTVDLTFDLEGLQRIAFPLVLLAFRRENDRLLRSLKYHAETPR